MNDTLTREVRFDMVDGGDGLTLTGYAAVFDTPTRINSWEGEFDERIARGAFKKTLSERTPVLQFDHGHHPLVGSIPIGQFTDIYEDERGLYVEARLHDNWLTEPVRDAIASQSVSGMSFRFSVVKEHLEQRQGDVDLRTLNEVRLFEAGPVVWPAYAATSVAVRHVADQWLRDIPRTMPQRLDIVRALLFDTPPVDEPRAALVEDVEPSQPSVDEPAPATRSVTPNIRRRLLDLVELAH